MKHGNQIVILSTGRSGSSLVAGLLHDAGVWFGHCRRGDGWNPTGYFENTAIKTRIYRKYGRDWAGEPPNPRKKLNVGDILEEEGYREGPWAVKHGGFYGRIWSDPVFVCVHRPMEKIIESYGRCGWLNRYENLEAFISRHIEILNGFDGFRIDADRLIQGDRSQMNALGDVLGLDIPLGRINKELWH